MMTAPFDIYNLQLQPYQFYSRYEVVFDINWGWQGISCTYKWNNSSRIWVSTTGYHVPFWCSLLILSQTYIKWFMAFCLKPANQKLSQRTWYLFFMYTGRYMQVFMVIWTVVAGLRPSEISEPYWYQRYGTLKTNYLTYTTPTKTANMLI